MTVKVSYATGRIFYADRDPGLSEDTGQELFSFWSNTDTKKIFMCDDPTMGAQIWNSFVREDNFNALFDARAAELGLAPQVQSNWTETDDMDPSYIKNKP